jgi:hypothetical protein
VFFLGFGVFTGWWGCFLFSELAQGMVMAGSLSGHGGKMVGHGLAALLSLYFGYRVYGLLSNGLKEPLWRAVHLRVRSGSKGDHVRLLKSGGFLVGGIAPATIFGAAGLIHREAAGVLLVSTLIIFGFLFFTRSLVKQAQGAPSSTRIREGEVELEHRFAQVTNLVVRTVVIATVLIILWTVASNAEVPAALGMRPLPQANAVEQHLMAAAALAALIWTPGIEPAKRWSIVVGLVSGHLAEVLFGDWGEGAVPIVTVAAAAFPFLLQRASTRRAAAIRALEISWRFNVAAAVGRLLGRVVGALLLGTSGLMLGEVFGEVLLTLLGVETSTVASGGRLGAEEAEAQRLGAREKIRDAGEVRREVRGRAVLQRESDRSLERDRVGEVKPVLGRAVERAVVERPSWS